MARASASPPRGEDGRLPPPGEVDRLAEDAGDAAISLTGSPWRRTRFSWRIVPLLGLIRIGSGLAHDVAIEATAPCAHGPLTVSARPGRRPAIG
jgi:hypothetical protein